MPCKALAAIGLPFCSRSPQGCASLTPTPTPSVYAAELGYASAEGLEGGDAEIYADAFADAKALDLGDANARDYANALVYLNAIASFNDWPVAEERIAEFIAAFDAAVKVNGASGREALSHAYAAQRGDEASAAAFAQTDASGVAAHVYANEYVPPHYAPEGEAVVMDELADSLAGVLARGYATSSASSVQERLNYAGEYYDGYAEAVFRAAHEQGYTDESRMRALADVIAALPEEQAHIYASSYADAGLAGRSDEDAATYAAAYEEAYTSQINDGATEEDARRHAAALADAALVS